MTKKIKKLIFIVVLISAIFFSLYVINDLFTVYSAHPDDLAFEDFYSLKKDTVDIICFGNSHSFMGINNIQIENDLSVDVFQIKSRGGGIENIVYQLEETLKTQSPKIVVLEMFCLHEFHSDDEQIVIDDKNNTNHWAFDTMRLSKLKVDAVNDNIYKDDKNEYLIPLIISHSRWKNENKALANMLNSEYESNKFNGFMPRSSSISSIPGDYLPKIDYNSEPLEVSDSKVSALKKFVSLCEQNDIKIVFVALPFRGQRGFSYQKLYDSIKYVQDEMELDNNYFIDGYPLMQQLGVDTTHFLDDGHLNYAGAVKISKYLSEYIDENMSDCLSQCVQDYKIDAEDDYQLMKSEYNEFDKICKRTTIQNKLNTYGYDGNIEEYLSLTDENHIIIISSRNNNPKYIDDNVLNAFNGLGLDFDVKNNSRENYIGIVNGDKGVAEFKSDELIEVSFEDEKIKSLDLPFKLKAKSSNINTGYVSSIVIKGKQQSQDKDGFNIVIYDTVLRGVVSSSCFNLNENRQYYFEREFAQEKYDTTKVVYTLDISKEIDGLLGAESSEVATDGVVIKANSDDPRFEILDYGANSNHILLKAQIECPHATWFEVGFNDVMQRQQLVTGDNEVYIEVELDEDISDIRIDIANNSGDYLINILQICDLSND